MPSRPAYARTVVRHILVIVNRGVNASSLRAAFVDVILILQLLQRIVRSPTVIDAVAEMRLAR